jgi:MFS transporter, DHA3 family, macrolide efflux protein
MSKIHKVLRNRNFFLLWLGQIISQLGDRLDQMALIAFIYLRAPGSTFEIAKILSFTIIPVFLVGPVAGVYVDRWDRRKTMYACDLIRCLLVLTIPLFLFYSKSFIPVYCVIFVAFSIGRFFIPAKLAIIPDIVEKKDLLMANSLVNITGMIASVLGLGISGVLIEWVGAKSGFYIDSLSFLISGILIFMIAHRSRGCFNVREVGEVGKDVVAAFRKSVFQEIKEGIGYFIKKREIRLIAGIMFVLWSALGSVYVVIIVFVQKTLNSATKDLGLLGMFLGVGLFLGSLAYGRYGQGVSKYRAIFGALIVSGLTLVVFAMAVQYYPVFRMAALLAFLLGLAIAPIMIASNTIIHSASDEGMLGKIFSSLEIVMHLAFLLFMFVSSGLAELFTPGAILIAAGGVVAALGVGTLIFHDRILAPVRSAQ